MKNPFYKILLLYLLTIYCYSCKEDFYKEEVKKYLDEIGVNLENKLDTVYIIPTEGCHTCIDNALDRISKQNNSFRIIVIFIGPKIPTVAYNASFPKNMSIYLDSTYLKNKFQTNIFESTRVVIKNGKLSVEKI